MYIYTVAYTATKNIDSLGTYWHTDLVIPNISPQSTLQGSKQLVPDKVL